MKNGFEILGFLDYYKELDGPVKAPRYDFTIAPFPVGRKIK
jgi:hypothetical protein